MTGGKSRLDTELADQFVERLKTLTANDWCFIYGEKFGGSRPCKYLKDVGAFFIATYSRFPLSLTGKLGWRYNQANSR